MKIGDVDIRAFRAKQLTVDILPPQTSVSKEWLPRALRPTEGETETTFSSVEVKLLIRGRDRNDATNKISDINALLQSGTVLTLDGYERRFMAYATGNGEEKTLAPTKYLAEFSFDGYWFSDEVVVELPNIATAEFEAQGNRTPPCKVVIIPDENIDELTITGFAEVMTLYNLPRGATIIIDGVAGTVTQDGANKFEEFEGWDFPYLNIKGDKKNAISFGTTKCDIKIAYNPMWL